MTSSYFEKLSFDKNFIDQIVEKLGKYSFFYAFFIRFKITKNQEKYYFHNIDSENSNLSVKCKNWKDYTNFNIFFVQLLILLKKYLYFHHLLTWEDTQIEDIILENPKRNLTKSEILKREKNWKNKSS